MGLAVGQSLDIVGNFHLATAHGAEKLPLAVIGIGNDLAVRGDVGGDIAAYIVGEDFRLVFERGSSSMRQHLTEILPQRHPRFFVCLDRFRERSILPYA